MRNFIIGFGLITASILNIRYDLLQKYQRLVTKAPYAESPVMRFSNRYFVSGFMIFFGVFWLILSGQR